MTYQQKQTKKDLILLVGLPYSGKTSIHRIVFGNKTPGQTQNFRPTPHIQKIRLDGLSQNLEVWDIPGILLMEMDHLLMTEILKETVVVIFVFNCQTQSFSEQLSNMSLFVDLAHNTNNNIQFEFFLHKCDNGNERFQIMKNEVEENTKKLLENKNINIDVNLTLTSIYDDSLFVFFSNLLMRLYCKSFAFNEYLKEYNEVCFLSFIFYLEIIRKSL